MTGWGQHGPLAQAAGHDINYIALTGALHAIGTADRPVPPLNLLGTTARGSLYLVMASGRIARGAAVWAGAGGGCGDHRRRRQPDGAVHRPIPARCLRRTPRKQHAGRRMAVVRGVRNRRWTARERRAAGAAVLRSLVRVAATGSRVAVRALGPFAVAGPARGAGAALQEPPRGPLGELLEGTTPASRPCCRSAKPPGTRTTSRVAHSWCWMASRIPHWRRASRGRRQPSSQRRPLPPGTWRTRPLARLKRSRRCIAGAGCLGPLPVGQREVILSCSRVRLVTISATAAFFVPGPQVAQEPPPRRQHEGLSLGPMRPMNSPSPPSALPSCWP